MGVQKIRLSVDGLSASKELNRLVSAQVRYRVAQALGNRVIPEIWPAAQAWDLVPDDPVLPQVFAEMLSLQTYGQLANYFRIQPRAIVRPQAFMDALSREVSVEMEVALGLPVLRRVQ